MGEKEYTYREAAHRVGRAVRTIKRWRRGGMPMGWNAAGERIVSEAVLLAEYRRRLMSWPTHQYRMRKQREEEQHD